MWRLWNEIYFNGFWDWKNCFGAPVLIYGKQTKEHFRDAFTYLTVSRRFVMKRLFILSSEAFFFFLTALQAQSLVMINRFKCEYPGYMVSQHDECRKVCLRLHVCLLSLSQRRHFPDYFSVPKQRKTKGPRSLNLHPGEKPTDGTTKSFYIQQRCYISDTMSNTTQIKMWKKKEVLTGYCQRSLEIDMSQIEWSQNWN